MIFQNGHVIIKSNLCEDILAIYERSILEDKILASEKKYLKKVRSHINAERKINTKFLSQHDEDLRASWDYMWNTSGLDSGDIAALKVEQEVEQALFANRFFRDKMLRKMYPKPYFSRINFKTNKTMKVYIGFGSVMDKDYNSYVYDWRAPISSMYYDFETGPAHYHCKDGTIKGNITSKKQYKIEDGKLIYMFESDLNIEDDILKEALGKNTNDKMKDIVNTIQKEQNKIIRNLDDDVLLVEGPAGCGKTSVGLHRIAFLLYQYRETLMANQILIFSPNKVFTDYIDEVLPSLGEQNAMTTMFSEYIDKFIGEYKNVEEYMSFIERIYETEGAFENKIIATKLDDKYKNVLDEYIKHKLNTINYQDVYLKEELITSQEDLAKMYKDFKYFAPYKRLEKIIQNTIMNFKTKLAFEPFEDQDKIRPKVREIVKKSVPYEADYKKLLTKMYQDNKFKKILNKYFKDLDINTFTSQTIKDLKEKNIKYEDAIILMYLKGELGGYFKDGFIKQVIIDEAQDYNKMQYEIISKTFRKAQYTILGDANQIINPLIKMNNLKELISIFKDYDTNYLRLKTTYRNTFEITKFANNILSLDKVNPIDRHGEKPTINKNLEFNQLLIKLEKIIAAFKNSIHGTLAIIVKDLKTADKIYKSLKDTKDINHYSDKHALSNSIVVLPICYAKGLEFDEVCIIELISNRFKKNEQKLLYVAATRPLQKLTLLSEK